MVDVENEYWEKDTVIEDVVEELTIDTTEDSDESDDSDDEELLYSDDQRPINMALTQTHSMADEPTNSAANFLTNPRRELMAQF